MSEQGNVQCAQAAYAAFGRGISPRSWISSPRMWSGCYRAPPMVPLFGTFRGKAGVQE